jgi:hypothetical protein
MIIMKERCHNILEATPKYPVNELTTATKALRSALAMVEDNNDEKSVLIYKMMRRAMACVKAAKEVVENSKQGKYNAEEIVRNFRI